MSDIFMDILDAFTASLKSADSKRAYRRSCSSICEYCGKQYLSLTHEDVRNYGQHLVDCVAADKYSASYATAEYRRVRSVASYIEDNTTYYKLHYDNPFNDYYFPVAAAAEITASQLPSMTDINLILSRAAGDDELYLGLSLIYRCSLASGEVIGIRRNDFILDGNAMLLKITKRDFTRYIVVPDDIRTLINRYVSEHPASSYAPLLLNKHGKELMIRAFQKRYEKITAECGIDCTMNDIRNASITYMMTCGASGSETARYIGINERWMSRYKGAADKLNIVTNDYSNIRVFSGDRNE